MRVDHKPDGLFFAFGCLLLVQFDIGGVRLFGSDLVVIFLAARVLGSAGNPFRYPSFLMAYIGLLAVLSFSVLNFSMRFGELPPIGALLGRGAGPVVLAPYLVVFASNLEDRLKSVFSGFYAGTAFSLVVFAVTELVGVRLAFDVVEFGRLTSFMSDPNAFGVACASVAMFYLVHSPAEARNRILVLVACMLLSLSRTAWLAFAGSAVFLAAACSPFRQLLSTWYRPRGISRMLFLSFIAALLFWRLEVWSQYVAPVTESRPDTGSTRLRSLDRALSEFDANPVVGGGLGSTRFDGAVAADHIVHSTFGWILGEAGLIGLAAGVLFLVFPAIIVMLKSRDRTALGCAVVVIVQVVGSFGIDGFGQRLWWLALGPVWVELVCLKGQGVSRSVSLRGRKEVAAQV